MALLRKISNPNTIYQHQKKNILVAIEKPEEKILIKSVKENRKAPEKNKTQVKGYQFIMDEEFGTLKIDFSKQYAYLVKDLAKVKET